jgi:hypothetical protein
LRFASDHGALEQAYRHHADLCWLVKKDSVTNADMKGYTEEIAGFIARKSTIGSNPIQPIKKGKNP